MIKTLLITASVVAIVTVSAIACTYVNTAANVATAPARVVDRAVSTNNILNSYEGFFRVKQSFDTLVLQIQRQKADLAEETDIGQKRIIRTNLLAQRTVCTDLANRYNNDAMNRMHSFFMDGRLPRNLDVSLCDQ